MVDPARVCIVGASFGGYSALAGATLNPQAYRCAVSVNGVSDLPQSLGETVTAYGKDSDSFRYWRQVMGSTAGDPTALTSISPARQVTKATPPVLLVWGGRDTTVLPAQSERMRDALQAAEGAGPFDLVFIDADKVNTPAYFEWALGRTRPGGLIVADNVVRGGSLADATDPDPATQAQRRLPPLAGDPRVSATTIQTVDSKGYDGFLLALVESP